MSAPSQDPIEPDPSRPSPPGRDEPGAQGDSTGRGRTQEERNAGDPTVSGCTVEECTEVTDELVAAMGHLIPQLSSSSPPPGRERLAEIIGSPACHLLLASDSQRVLGSMTLVVFPIPTGIRAWIEDVVVDSAARGRGVGEALNRRAIEIATERGARTVDLTSRPRREAANRLYKRLGFVERDTNVYRLVPEGHTGD